MFSRVAVCAVVACDTAEGDVEEKKEFWNDLNRIKIK